jgi:hypothetical protein
MLSDQFLSEIEAGEGQRLAVAARLLPSARRDKPVTLSCLLRWVLDGVRGPGGQRIRLEACRLSGKWITTPGALRRFVEAQTPELANAEAQTPRLDAKEIPAPRSPTRRHKASEHAARELEKMGL